MQDLLIRLAVNLVVLIVLFAAAAWLPLPPH